MTCVACLCNYITIINSIAISSAVLQTRFGFNEIEAGYFFTLPYVVAAVLSPMIGIFVTKFGYRMTVICVGQLINVIAHILLMTIPDCEKCTMSVVPYIMLGFSYATYAVVLWGSVPYMVEARLLGTAFGFCTVSNNTGTLMALPIMGKIQESTADVGYGYFWVEVFFACVGTLGFLSNLTAYFWDKKHRDNLLQSNMPLKEFERYTQTRIST